MKKSTLLKHDEWVVVAEYQLDIDADIAVSLLKGNGVPVVRFPIVGQVAPHWALMQPVRVLVPPDQVEAARELLQDETEE